MLSAARAFLAALACSAALAFASAPPAGALEYPPNANVWVNDTAEVIDAAAHSEIKRLFAALEADTGIDAVALTINSVDDYQPGVVFEDFATGLFNNWGLGDAGVDDGILLLVAVKDRKARVVIGDGFSESYVGEAEGVIDTMLPAFREDRYSDGILTGAQEIASRFRSLGDSTADPVSDGNPAGSGSASGFLDDISDEEASGEGSSGGGVPDALWYALGGGGAALFGAGGFVTWQRIKPRRCASCNREMKRIKGRQAERPLLAEGQNVEEDLDSVEYDVYECTSCGAHKIERHGKLFSRYHPCPKCNFKTLETWRQTVMAATYDHGGTDRVTNDCKHCEYHEEHEVSTPQKVRRTSSSSSSRSSSRRDRPGPSGGGRSSGRGASGSW